MLTCAMSSPAVATPFRRVRSGSVLMQQPTMPRVAGWTRPAKGDATCAPAAVLRQPEQV